MRRSLTHADADRLERAVADASESRGAELQHVDGNPLAIEDRSFGGVRARLVGRDLAYYRYFSGPARLLPDDAAVVPGLAAWYAERGAPCLVRLSPLFSSHRLLCALAGAGLAETGVLSLLYGSPGATTFAGAVNQVTVVEVSPETDQTFLDLWTADTPLHERPLRQRLARAEFAHWRRYLAFVDQQPAAHAAMFVSAERRTAVLAAAGTRPAQRGRGCQTALVVRRMADAVIAGCDLVAAEADPDSPSQRNLERCGLQLAVTRTIWELPR